MAQQADNFLVDSVQFTSKHFFVNLCSFIAINIEHPTTSPQSLNSVSGQHFVAATLDVLIFLHMSGSVNVTEYSG